MSSYKGKKGYVPVRIKKKDGHSQVYYVSKKTKKDLLKYERHERTYVRSLTKAQFRNVTGRVKRAIAKKFSKEFAKRIDVAFDKEKNILVFQSRAKKGSRKHDRDRYAGLLEAKARYYADTGKFALFSLELHGKQVETLMEDIGEEL